MDDARAHGYHHVEVPLLHWSTTGAVQPQSDPEADPLASAAPDGLQ